MTPPNKTLDTASTKTTMRRVLDTVNMIIKPLDAMLTELTNEPFTWSIPPSRWI
jgi:hypothetical protein